MSDGSVRRIPPSLPTAGPAFLPTYLPAYLTEDNGFRDFLGLFTVLADETMVHGDALPYLADLDITGGPMLRYLGHWLAFDELDPGLPDARQRQLVSALGNIVAWRGTHRGLTELLTLVTNDEVSVTTGARAAAGGAPPGERGVAAAVGGVNKVVTVRVANTGWLTVQQFAEFVRNEIPADCTLDLSIGGTSAGGTFARTDRERPKGLNHDPP